MKIFISGASGFIGGAILEKLAEPHHVLGMARSKKGMDKVTRLGGVPINVNLDSVTEKNLAYCEVVIHCAAFVEPYGSYEDFHAVNVEGTRKILDAARKAGVRRFIHIGTEAALFTGDDLVDIDEGHPYPSHSPFHYSETKKLAEQLVLKAHEPGKFETISLRPRLVWGPGDTTILANLTEMVDKGRFRWIDEGSQKTSTTHIANLVHAVELAVNGAGRSGQAYFITDREVHTMREFMTRYLATAGRNPGNKNISGSLVRLAARIVEGSYRLFRIKRKPPLTRFSASIMSATVTIASDKAEQEMGYQPVITVDEGMKQLGSAGGSGPATQQMEII